MSYCERCLLPSSSQASTFRRVLMRSSWRQTTQARLTTSAVHYAASECAPRTNVTWLLLSLKWSHGLWRSSSQRPLGFFHWSISSELRFVLENTESQTCCRCNSPRQRQQEVRVRMCAYYCEVTPSTPASVSGESSCGFNTCRLLHGGGRRGGKNCSLDNERKKVGGREQQRWRSETQTE